jgi:hypothetical protein
VTGLLNGTYTVRATASGFAEFAADNIFLVERESRRLNETKVEVAAGAQLIETETARIADVKEHVVLETIPMFLRRTVDLMLMSPMVIKPPSGYKIGGSRVHQSEQTYDGISAAGATGGTLCPREMSLNVAAIIKSHNSGRKVLMVCPLVRSRRAECALRMCDDHFKPERGLLSI